MEVKPFWSCTRRTRTSALATTPCTRMSRTRNRIRLETTRPDATRHASDQSWHLTKTRSEPRHAAEQESVRGCEERRLTGLMGESMSPIMPMIALASVVCDISLAVSRRNSPVPS
eukprot:1414616-Rhodomonas_salina.1